jgi:hypothetical protein
MPHPNNVLLTGLVLLLLLLIPVSASGATAIPADTVSPVAPGAITAAATTISLEPSKDNTLYQSNTGALSNGAGQYIFAGMTRSNLSRRAVLAFDVANALPQGAQIISVTLQLNMSKSIAGSTPVTVHRLDADWGEGTSDASGDEGGGTTAAAGDATWIHTFSPDGQWKVFGGDFAKDSSATQSVGSVGLYTWSSSGLARDVQGWLNAPTTNFGWIVVGKEEVNTTAKRFDSREHGTAANRPKLTITYVTSPSLFLPQISAQTNGR